MSIFKKTEGFHRSFFNRQNSTFHSSNHRSSRPEVVLKNFAKFTGKHMCQSLFFNKVASFAKFLITPFLTEHLR